MSDTPNVPHISTSIEQLVAAATSCDSDLHRYPDGLATGTEHSIRSVLFTATVSLNGSGSRSRP